MKTKNNTIAKKTGSALVMAMILLLILSIIGLSMLTAAEEVQQYSVRTKRETAAAAAAEAAYERAVFWMSQQPDLFLAMDQASPEGTVNFPDSSGSYQVRFAAFADYRPVFRVTARGQSGIYEKYLDVYLVQAITGWEMGLCRIPSGPSSTTEVYFAADEIIAMPIHINSYKQPDDEDPDIHVQGDPMFLGPVSMSESRYSASKKDKYKKIIDVFDSGIYFNQPRSRISDEDTIKLKFDWFRKTLLEQKPGLILTPVKNPGVANGQPAVHMEFFVGPNGKGYVRITRDCTVRGYQRTISDSDTWDYKIKPGSGGTQYEKYPIYGYHYIPLNAETIGKQIILPVEDTYVTPKYGTFVGTPGGQIYVEGNVLLGSAPDDASIASKGLLNTVQGRITIVATGNIWLTNAVRLSDKDDSGQVYPRGADGLPHKENPNSLGLVARGVVKIIDPGLVETLGAPAAVSDAVYQPAAILDTGYSAGSWHRHLPDPMIVEAAITACGGGWGAENVERSGYGGRKEQTPKTDDLIVRGLLAESIRGVVGVIGSDGYVKKYYLDERLTRGIVPGNLWFKGKYIPIPGGWNESREQNP
jgi:hypothetical protein